jgi:hypothetical protein
MIMINAGELFAMKLVVVGEGGPLACVAHPLVTHVSSLSRNTLFLFQPLESVHVKLPAFQRNHSVLEAMSPMIESL